MFIFEKKYVNGKRANETEDSNQSLEKKLIGGKGCKIKGKAKNKISINKTNIFSSPGSC